jgi:hypothetical protein
MTEDELQRLLADDLALRFPSARALRASFLPVRFISVQVGQWPDFDFGVGLRRSKYGDDEWVLMIGPWQFRDLLGLLLGHNMTGFSPELMQVCRSIHTMLTSAPGITNVRWYFKGARSQSSAVWTPDELPWDQV